MAIQFVREIIRLPESLTQLPESPAAMLGVINLRGAVIPTICLRQIFEMEESSASDRKALIVETSHGVVGLAVDEVREVRTIPLGLLEKTSGVSQAESDKYIAAVANQDGVVTVIVDVAEIETEFSSVFH